MSNENFQKAFLNNFTIFVNLKGNKIILHQAHTPADPAVSHNHLTQKSVSLQNHTTHNISYQLSHKNPSPGYLSLLPLLLTTHTPDLLPKACCLLSSSILRKSLNWGTRHYPHKGGAILAKVAFLAIVVTSFEAFHLRAHTPKMRASTLEALDSTLL